MKEYTFIALGSIVFTLLLDRASQVNILKRREYYFFLLSILFFKLLVNGYLTARSVVIYNPAFFLGLRIGTIPLEDFLFGFSMVTQAIIFWEYFKKLKI